MPRELIPIVMFMVGGLVMICYPLARAWAKRIERNTSQPRIPDDLAERIARIEHAVESIAIEVERISEGQRFTTQLIAGEQSPRLHAGAKREV